uniref:Cathepsin propeptide inhibitor domain-containing protein n=1 Tax=Knipowitschia caucasica TaxID=637954 RepID=A0AAV2L8E3_KNICA
MNDFILREPRLLWGESHLIKRLEEEAERRAIWEETRIRVNAHNKEADQGLHTNWQGLNQFSDRKPEERMKACTFVTRQPEVSEPGLVYSVLPIYPPNISLIVDAAENSTVLLLNSTDTS